MAGTLVANTINTDTGLFSTNNAYSGIAKAWVTFNGSTGTINGSFNVGSITKNTTGDYTLNFTTAMSNANYASAGFATSNDTSTGHQWSIVTSRLASEQTTNNTRITTSVSYTATQADFPLVSFIVVGA